MASIVPRKILLFLCEIILIPCRFLGHKILAPILVFAFRRIDRWFQNSYDRSPEGQRAKKAREERDAYIMRQPPQIRGMKNPPGGITRDEVESSSDFTNFYSGVVDSAAHEDGKSTVIYLRSEDNRVDAARHFARVYDALFGPQPYSRTEIKPQEVSNSRIIQRVCNIQQGIRVVRPGIGSLSHLTLPSLKWEAGPGQDWIALSQQAENDLLSLYYRWALHAISAIAFCHRKRVYLQAIDVSSFWIQSDFSLVLAGLAQARIPAPTYVYELSSVGTDGGAEYWRYDFVTGRWYARPAWDDSESDPHEASYSVCHEQHKYNPNGTNTFMYSDDIDTLYSESFGDVHIEHDPNFNSAAKEDIFWWATFVLRLFTNTLAKHEQVDISDWSLCRPTCPPSYRTNQGYEKIAPGFKLHDSADWLLNLRPEQLGNVLSKAFKGEFKSADEVLSDLRQALRELGRDVDENDDLIPGLGRAWEDTFTVLNGGGGDYRKGSDPVWAREIKFVGDFVEM